MAFLVPATLLGWYIGDKIADAVVSGATAVHDTYLSIEKSIMDLADQSQKAEVEQQRRDYREKARQMQEKYHLV